MSRNFLANETSPYLLQHKDNPVHWYPWGETALAAARAARKPILLSIGYAACHWCHVMAHESFEDDEVAAVMNRLFINIKVDREERPDIDTIYMTALHLLGVQGGWPLTMFLTPDGEPFWGGTYFPKNASYGRPAFTDLLEEIARLFDREPDKIEQNRAALMQALSAREVNPGELKPDILPFAADKLLGMIDPVHGGIKGAPKFPQAPNLTLLWRMHLETGRADYAAAVMRSLDHMCEGGIYDHLRGGFSRYSTDERWLAPHFEKMLYDNAQLISLLTSVWTETHKPLYAQRIRETIAWLFAEMRVPAPDQDDHAFAASLDADSEGEEGRFYVWSKEELADVLGEDTDYFAGFYDVSAEGNWEEKNILNRLAHADTRISEQDEQRLAPLRARLLARRAGRIRPGFDDKVLADWNGLMIAALSEAGAALEEPDWITAAARAYRFVKTHMIRDGRLFHTWREGRLQHRAMADDLANMAHAALSLAGTAHDSFYVADAEAFVAELNAHYRDAENGGYFFTADDAEGLIIRTRSASDNPTPAANGLLPDILTRLYHHTGKSGYLDQADQIFRGFAGELGRNFFPLGTYLSSFDTRLHTIQIALIGSVRKETDQLAKLRKAVFSVALPSRVLIEQTDDQPLAATHPAFGKTPVNGQPAAYVCVGESCSLPITDPGELAAALKRARHFQSPNA